MASLIIDYLTQVSNKIMKIIWSKKADAILKIGYPLKEIGIHNWALKKSDALVALEKFAASNISILGGDVYEIINQSIQSNYDSWHCDRMPNESRNDFLKRSIEKAKIYMEQYESANNNILFALIPDV
jgi:hypothetical protein